MAVKGDLFTPMAFPRLTLEKGCRISVLVDKAAYPDTVMERNAPFTIYSSLFFCIKMHGVLIKKKKSVQYFMLIGKIQLFFFPLLSCP